MASRKRLTPQESRSSALEAARALLIESGPQAVTLKAVAGRIGRTNADLLDHFGPAAVLQKELERHLAEPVCENTREAVRTNRPGMGSPSAVRDRDIHAPRQEGNGKGVG